VSANWNISRGQKWRASVYLIERLDDPSTDLFTDINYRLSKDWQLGVRATLNKYQYRTGSYTVDSSGQDVLTWTNYTQSFNDFELTVGKRIGSRVVSIGWSEAQKKILFDVVSSAF
jgi:hypothetical protein